MSISTLNYRKTYFLKPDPRIILGIPTYDALLQIQPELKTNDTSVHSNLRDATHRNLGLLMADTKYDTLSIVPYIRHVQPIFPLIPNNATRVAY